MRGLRLFRIFGIDIEAHISWFVILGLITFSLAGYFGPSLKEHSPLFAAENSHVAWFLAFLGAIFLFGSVITHELAHSLIARIFGYKVNRIVLFFLGGGSLIEGLDDSNIPSRTFVITAVGPLSNFALAGLLYAAVFLILPETTESPYVFSVALLMSYLVFTNIVLGLFNLIPAFPLDGGRMLVSVLRLLGLSRIKAMLAAVWVGGIFSVVMIAGGMAELLFWGNFGGIMLILMGIFLISAASAEYKHLKSRGL